MFGLIPMVPSRYRCWYSNTVCRRADPADHTTPRIPVQLRKLLMLVLTLLLSSQAFAVELKGQIKGVVIDEEGLPVPGAVVLVESPALQGAAGDETDVDGRFRAVGLSPGTYTVEISKPQFYSYKATDVFVGAGSTISLDVTLKIAMAGEVIVVEEEAPVVDVTSTKTGVTFTKEMLRDIPNAARDYQSAVSMSPGMVGSGNPNIHGGFDISNQYYLDGVNTTDPLTNTFSMNMNFDAIEEIQVITGGMDAEYGRSLGAAVNIITRSGGNEFEGDAQLLYSGSATQAYKALPDENKDEQQYSDASLALNLGGPIVLDKLWYFTSLQMNYSLSTLSVPDDVGRPDDMPMEPRDWRSVYLFGKLTWKPNPNNQVWLHAQTDPTVIKNANQNPYGLPNSELWWRQGGTVLSLGHQWTPTKDTVMDNQIYFQNNYLHAVPMNWRDCDEWSEDGFACLDDYSDVAPYGQWFGYEPDSFNYGPYQYPQYNIRKRASLSSSITQYFDFLGEHQMKTGIQADYMYSFYIFPGIDQGAETWSYGDASPTDFASYEPYYKVVYDSDYETRLQGLLGSWYLQDVWNPIPKLTLRPGVRLDATRLINDADVAVFESLTFSPRFGAAYDIAGDNRWKVHAYYGRFYDSGYLGVADILAARPGGYGVYYWDEEGGADGTGDWNDEPAYSVAPNFLVHDDLNNPYSDEYNLGVSRDLGSGWGMDLTFVYEEAHNFWEDDEVNLIWNDDGTEVIGSRDGGTDSIYRFRTPEELYTKYTSIEVLLVKQFIDKWSFVGSYTWSHSYGTQDDMGATGYYDIPEQRAYEEGVLAYDVPHYIKLSGSYRDDSAWDVGNSTSLGFLFGWHFYMKSGYPYRRSYYNAYYDGWGNLGDDGDSPDRLDAVAQTNLKAGLTLMAGRTKWDLTLECFNAFDSRTVVSVDTTYNDSDGSIFTDDNGDILYGTPLSRLDPRYFQIGLRGEF